MSINQSVLIRINSERKKQDEIFGPELDDGNTNRRWHELIEYYLKFVRDSKEIHEFEKDMVKVASLAIAALESTYRKFPGDFEG